MNTGRYRLIFNQRLGMLMPVAEIAIARGKTTGGTTRGGAAGIRPDRWSPRLLPLLIALSLTNTPVLANPDAPSVISGTAAFSTLGNELTVRNSANAIINWRGFSIGADEITRFVQPDAQSSVLNRITGGDPSQILGRLQSNGKVFLVNPNGVFIGRDSRIDVGGFVASTLNLSNEDFLSSQFNFTDTGTQAGIVNQGRISTTAGGQVWLIGHDVENSGVIDSPDGKVIIAAGKHVEMAPNGAEDFSVSFTADDEKAVNLGEIISQGGEVNIFAALIRQQGVVQADSLTQGDNGKILLKANKNLTLAEGSLTTANSTHAATDGGTILALADMASGQVYVAGQLQAKAADGNGGFIETSAARVDIVRSTSVDASSASGKAGTWLIDPIDITIVSAGSEQVPENGGVISPTLQPSTVNAETLMMALNGGSSVAIDTHGGTGGNGDITLSTAISINPDVPGAMLALNADRNIVLNQDIVTAGLALDLVLNHGASGSVALASNKIIDLGGGTLDVQNASKTSSGTFGLGAGRLRNSVLKSASISSSGGTLDGVTLGSDLMLNGSLNVEHDLTLADGITVDKGNNYWYFRSSGTQRITTPGVATINNAGGYFYAGYGVTGQTLQFDSGMTVQGYGHVSDSSAATVINNGTISANTTGQTFTIDPNIFVGGDSGNLDVSGGTLSLNAANWSNVGVFTVSAGTLNLGGAFSTSDIGNFDRSGGTVNISGTLNNSQSTLDLGTSGLGTGTLSISGRIVGGTLLSSDVSPTLTSSGGTLDGVTLGSDLMLNGSLNVEHDLTLADGITVDKGNNYWYFRSSGTQRITTPGVATINNAGGYFYAGYGVTGQTLQIDSGITLQGHGQITDSSAATLVNAGKISANTPGQTFTISTNVYNGAEGGTLDVSGGTLSLNAANWSNTGAFTVSAGTLNLGGAFSTFDIGNFDRSGGTVNISGTLNNSQSTLDLGTSGLGTGTLSISGRIVGGTLLSSDVSPTLTSSSGTLDGVTLGSDLTISGSVFIENGITLADGITVDKGNNYWYFRTGGTQHIATPGAATLNSSGGNIYAGYGVTGQTLQIDSGITLQGYGQITDSSAATLVNAGKISANTPGQTLTISTNVYNGVDGSTLDVSGGTLSLNAASWNNAGAFTVSAGTLNLGGAFSTSDIGNFDRSGGTVNISGTLDNSGATLDLGTNGLGIGTLNVSGRIIGGTLLSSDLSPTLTSSSGTLDGVTLGSDLTIDGSVFIENGITLADGITVDKGNNYWYFRTTGTQHIATPGAATLNSAGGNFYAGYGVTGQTLHIDAGITLQGYGQLTDSTTASVINFGTISANATGQTFTINPDSFTNSGILNVSAGTLSLNTAMTTAQLGTVTSSGGAISLPNTLDNTGSTLDIGSAGIGSALLTLSGRIKGGTLINSNANAPTLTSSSATLDGVTLGSDLTINGSLFIDNGLTLADGISVNKSNNYWYFRSGGTQHIATDGAATINSAGGYFYAGYGVTGQTLQIDSGITVQGYGGITDSSVATVVNAGTIRANTAGQSFTINPNGFSNTGTLDVTAGTLSLSTAMTTAQLGTISSSGGAISLTNVLDNTSDTLDIGSAGFGSAQLTLSGRIKGGSLVNSNATTPTLNSSGLTLDGVTLGSDMTIGGSLNIDNGITLADGVTVNKGNGYWYFRTTGEQHVATPGAATIVSSGGLLYAGYGVTGQTLNLDSGITLQGYGGISNSSVAAVVNAGTIRANTAGQNFTINPNSFSNTGTLDVSAGTLSLNTAMTTAQLGTITSSGGAISLTNVLDNTNDTLDIGSAGFGSALLTLSGRITGGTLVNSNATPSMTSSGVTLDGVTLGGDLTINGSLNIENGITLADGVTVNKGNGYWYFRTTGEQHVATSGAATIASSGGLLYAGYGVTGQTLQIDSGITLQGYGGISNSSVASVINAGTIKSDTAGQSFTITPNSFTNNGALNVDAGSMSVNATSFTQNGVVDIASGATFIRNAGFANNGSLRGSGSVNVGAANTLTNNGTIAPGGVGAPGKLSLIGNLVMGSSGVVELEIGGTVAGSYDVLSVSAAASLDGSLNLSTINNYIPTAASNFNGITAASLSGDFSSKNIGGYTASPSGNNYLVAFAGTCAGTICFDNSDGTGLWSSPGNWNTNTLPGAGDVVVVDMIGQSVTLSSGSYSIDSLLFNSDFVFSGGSLNVAGSATFNGAYSQSGGASLAADSLRISSGSSVALGAVTARDIAVNSAGNITLSGALNAIDGIVLAAGGNFSNNVGTSAMNVSAGNWQVWSTQPDQDTLGGLVPAFKQYNATHGVTTPQGSGNGLFYTIAPSLGVGLTGAVSKTYDATTSASLAAANFNITGALGSDSVVLTHAAASFADKQVGSGKQITASGLAITSASASGIPVYGYQLASTTTSGSIGQITPKALTVSGITAASKTYDGTTGATVDTSNAVYNGLIANDEFSVSATAAFSDKNVGAGKMVALSSIYGGQDAGNYSITDQSGTTADITPKAATISGITAANKVYDGTTSATVDTANAVFSGLIANDVVSVSATGSFLDKAVGTGKTVTLSSIYGGQDVGNYSIGDQISASADITPKALTVSGVSVANKVYDGTTSATVDTANAVFSGLIGNDDLSVSVSGAFSDKNAGIGKPVNLSSSFSGADAGNYSITGQSVATANITPKAISISGITAADKMYDANTSASVNAAGANGWLGGDDVSVSASGTFSDKNVGSGKTVNLTSSYGGADVGNYSITDQSVTTAGITPKAISISGITAGNKTYDGNTGASVITTGAVGWISGDNVIVNVSGAFIDRNVGTAKTVNLTSSYSGADAGNYDFADQTTTTADISRLASVQWNGGSGVWSNAENWAGGAVPDAANVARVVLPTGADVRYDLSAGATQLDNLDSSGFLRIETGNLAVAQNLTTRGYQQTGGAVSASNLTVSDSFSQDGGSLAVAGLADLTQATGDLVVSAGFSAQDLVLKALNGAIRQTAALQLASLEASARGGISLDDAGNQVGSFSAANDGSGDISFTNIGVLNLGDVSNSAGNIQIDNTGALNSTGTVSASGNVSLVAHSPLSIGGGGVEAGGDISLTAGATSGAGDNLVINAALQALGSGSVSLSAGDDLAQNADISSAGGAINLVALTGNIAIAPTAAISTTGLVRLAATAGRVSGPVPAGAVIEQATAPVNNDDLVNQINNDLINTSVGLVEGVTVLDLSTLTEQQVDSITVDNLSTTSRIDTSTLSEAAMSALAVAKAQANEGLSISPGMSMSSMGEMLKLRKEFKTTLFNEALKILAQNRRAADLKECKGAVSANCMRVRSGAKQSEPPKPKLAHLPQIKRKIALLIGNNAYSGDIPALKGAIPDVQAVGDVLKSEMGYEVRIVRDARKADIVDAMNKLVEDADDNDSVAVYYAGHGYQLDKTGAGYWIPVDAAPSDPAGWVSNDDISKYLSNISARQILLISDSCYSGSFAKEAGVRINGEVQPKDVLSKRSVVVMSSGGEEPVADEGRDGHSIFAWTLMQAMRQVDGWKEGSALYQNVRDEVSKSFPQTPQYGSVVTAGHIAGGDFLFEDRQY